MSITAIDTNILLFALDAAAPEHLAARRFLDERHDDPDTVLSELVLLELYDAAGLVRRGVTHFATHNVKDFADLGFRQVFDPIA